MTSCRFAEQVFNGSLKIMGNQGLFAKNCCSNPWSKAGALPPSDLSKIIILKSMAQVEHSGTASASVH